MIRWRLQDGEEQARTVELAQTDFTLGRDPANDIVIEDPKASRFHAAVVLKGEGSYVLRDLGSSNGTLVNGADVFRHVLRPGDRVGIGEWETRYLGREEEDEGAQQTLFAMPAKRGAGAQTSPTTEPEGAVPSAAGALGLDGADFPQGQLLQVLKSAQVIGSTGSVRLMASRLLDNVLASLGLQTGFVLLSRGENLMCEAARPARMMEDPLPTGCAEAVYRAMDTRAPAVHQGEDARTLCIPLVASARAMGAMGVKGAPSEEVGDEARAVAMALCGLCGEHIENARRRAELQRQCQHLHSTAQKSHRFVGSSPRLREVFARVNQAAQFEYPLIITGQTGSGKDLVARAVHDLSRRSEGPFVHCNSAAIPENLLESEMFGYAPKSGIAGANPNGKPGKFEMADGGTLFLNEIGDLSLNMQAKLLRALDRGAVERLGSTATITVDVRVIAATNKDLNAMTEEGTFRTDLYHRLNCLQVRLPRLKQRESDILLLAAYFLEEHVPAPLNETIRFTRETARLLLFYEWPGNVRQLRYAILAAATRATAGRLEVAHFPDEIAGSMDLKGAVKTLDQVEKEHIEKVLRRAGGNKKRAAQLLGISRQTLYTKIEKYDIRPADATLDDG
ncbi:MAG: sigma 54-interacting transcriptional regulator [Planctomycetota bacterium]